MIAQETGGRTPLQGTEKILKVTFAGNSRRYLCVLDPLRIREQLSFGMRGFPDAVNQPTDPSTPLLVVKLNRGLGETLGLGFFYGLQSKEKVRGLCFRMGVEEFVGFSSSQNK